MEVELVIRGGLKVTFEVTFYGDEVDTVTPVAIAGVYKRCSWVVLTAPEREELMDAIYKQADDERADAEDSYASDVFMDSLYT